MFQMGIAILFEDNIYRFDTDILIWKFRHQLEPMLFVDYIMTNMQNIRFNIIVSSMPVSNL